MCPTFLVLYYFVPIVFFDACNPLSLGSRGCHPSQLTTCRFEGARAYPVVKNFSSREILPVFFLHGDADFGSAVVGAHQHCIFAPFGVPCKGTSFAVVRACPILKFFLHRLSLFF